MRTNNVMAGLFVLVFILSGLMSLYPNDEGPGSTNEVFLHAGLSPFTMHANLSFVKGNRIIALKYSHYGGFDVYDSYDLGIIYELPLINSSHWFFSVGVGVGFIAGYEIKDKLAFNVPVEAKLYYVKAKKNGIGIFFLYNINESEGMEIGGGICLKFKL